MTNTERPFMGPKPETEEPVWVTPFRAEDGQIRDANDDHVGGISGNKSSEEDDADLADLIAVLVNEYVSTRESSEPEVDTNAPFVGRTIFRAIETIDAAAVKGGWAFAYEVTPGRFWFAANRAEAIEQTSEDLYPGWPVESNEVGEYLDIETGEFVPVS